MEKDNIIALQKIDCNCNDCAFMIRDMVTYNESVEQHKQWQLDEFNQRKKSLIDKATKYKVKEGDLWKWEQLLNEAEKMKFQFDKSTNTISFGTCKIKAKAISFIPNTLQLDTQGCFKHRKEHHSFDNVLKNNPHNESFLRNWELSSLSDCTLTERVSMACQAINETIKQMLGLNYPNK